MTNWQNEDQRYGSYPWTAGYQPSDKRETDITTMGLPSDAMWMTSVGQHERQRIGRHYNPMGDPLQIAKNLMLAKKIGLKDTGYLGEAAKITSLYGAESFFEKKGWQKIFLLGIGLIAGYLIVKSVMKKNKKYSAASPAELRKSLRRERKFTDTKNMEIVTASILVLDKGNGVDADSIHSQIEGPFDTVMSKRNLQETLDTLIDDEIIDEFKLGKFRVVGTDSDIVKSVYRHFKILKKKSKYGIGDEDLVPDLFEDNDEFERFFYEHGYGIWYKDFRDDRMMNDPDELWEEYQDDNNYRKAVNAKWLEKKAKGKKYGGAHSTEDADWKGREEEKSHYENEWNEMSPDKKEDRLMQLLLPRRYGKYLHKSWDEIPNHVQTAFKKGKSQKYGGGFSKEDAEMKSEGEYEARFEEYFDTRRPFELWMEHSEDEWEGDDVTDDDYVFGKYESRDWFKKIIDKDFQEWNSKQKYGAFSKKTILKKIESAKSRTNDMNKNHPSRYFDGYVAGLENAEEWLED